MAQVVQEGFEDLDALGWAIDVGRSPWSEGCSKSDFILKGLLGPEDRKDRFVTP